MQHGKLTSFVLFLIMRKLFIACSRINKIIEGVNFGFLFILKLEVAN